MKKTRALLKVVTSSVSGHHFALETHIRKALKAECSFEEIEHALLLTAPSVGFPNMMEAIMILRSVIEDK
jgi:alkylhydroperoxidase/carboxymuconolactone decarboxylase family protein YurZ